MLWVRLGLRLGSAVLAVTVTLWLLGYKGLVFMPVLIHALMVSNGHFQSHCSHFRFFRRDDQR